MRNHAVFKRIAFFLLTFNDAVSLGNMLQLVCTDAFGEVACV